MNAKAGAVVLALVTATTALGEITGPRTAETGTVVLLQPGNLPGPFLWVVESDEARTLAGRRRLAVTAETPCRVRVTLYASDGKQITKSTHVLEFQAESQSTIPPAVSPATPKDVTPPPAVGSTTEENPFNSRVRLVVHSGSNCYWCDQWDQNQRHSIPPDWDVEYTKDRTDVEKYPTFDIHRGEKVVRLSGYQTAQALKNKVSQWEQ